MRVALTVALNSTAAPLNERRQRHVCAAELRVLGGQVIPHVAPCDSFVRLTHLPATRRGPRDRYGVWRRRRDRCLLARVRGARGAVSSGIPVARPAVSRSGDAVGRLMSRGTCEPR